MIARLLTGSALLVDAGWLHGHGVLVEDGRISAVIPPGEAVREGVARVRLPPGSLLCPGLIDVQVNGGGGLLFNDAPTQETARAMAAAHRTLGTTSILPTLITDTAAVMRQAACVVAEPEAGVLGVHFEGPFLSPLRPGVHRPELIRLPEEADLVMLEQLARDRRERVVVTLAPEMAPNAVARLAAAGVVVCAGHSAAGYEQVAAAVTAGLSGFTHVFNAMPPPAARDPGVVGAALSLSDTWCGVIADGIHVHPAMLRILLAARPERVFLVSDAMPPTGTTLDMFSLQGRTICRRDGCLRTSDGTLAGADICLADAVRLCVHQLGVPAARAIGMATAAAADFLGLGDQVGRIAPGRRADLVLFSPDLAVLGTWLAGVPSAIRLEEAA